MATLLTTATGCVHQALSIFCLCQKKKKKKKKKHKEEEGAVTTTETDVTGSESEREGEGKVSSFADTPRVAESNRPATSFTLSHSVAFFYRRDRIIL